MTTTSALPEARASVRAITDDAIAARRELHRHPELSTEEWRTQELITNWLNGIGMEGVQPCADTGVTAIVRGARPGPNLLWRADVDALPIEEQTGLPFASENAGVMHACGHDGHTAIALGMASLLQASRERLAGSVRFAFQPAEEHVGGAARMIRDGVMEEPKVDQAYGLHLWAPNPAGEARVTAGPIFAAATHFRIIIKGRGGHAAAPHEAVDPIVVAAHAITALQTVASRSIDPMETVVLTVGRLEAGKRGNIISESAMMSGTVRTFEARVLQRVLRRMDEILAGVTSAFGATHQLDTSTLDAVVNDADRAAMVEGVASAFRGAGRVTPARVTGGEDMCHFLNAVPGCFFLLGASSPVDGHVHPHHHPKFDIDEAAIPLGIELGLRIVEVATGSELA